MFWRITIGCLLATLLAIACYYYYPYKPMADNVRIDKLVVQKSKHRLYAYSKGRLIKTFVIATGQKQGKKHVQGDYKTPEGTYCIYAKNPNSGWHKNLGISYPNKEDIAAARQLGRPCGGDVKIHGLKNGWGRVGRFHRWRDWTAGCIAVTDEEMDDLYSHVAVGTPIVIEP